MRRSIALISALALSCASASANAATFATIKLVGYVPVMCEVDVVGTYLENDRLLVAIRRTCNTGHSVVISGQQTEGAANVVIRELATGRSSAGANAEFIQPERFVDTVDLYEVSESGMSSPTDLEDFARTLHIGVQVA